MTVPLPEADTLRSALAPVAWRAHIGRVNEASELVRRIEAGGGLTDPAWRAAFEAVPRELFVPYYYLPAIGGYRRLWRNDPDPGERRRWREGVYEDAPLAIRVRDGELVSSSSQPSLMALMLEALDVPDGADVLEIGTGSGYNAGLLSERLGDSHVTTVDLDPALTETAATHLAEAGYRPHVVTGDGAQGCTTYAPYDRIIATCAVQTVPYAWLTQSADGALVLTPFATGLLPLRIERGDEGEVRGEGRFLQTPAFFVPLRGGPPPWETGAERPKGVPRGAWVDDSFRFALALLGGAAEPAEIFDVWRSAGRPERERYGVTVSGERQWAWLDSPTGGHAWELRSEEA